MGLADWVDDERLAKEMSKDSSKIAIKKKIRQWIKEIYFNKCPNKLLKVELNINDDVLEGIITYDKKNIIKGNYRGDGEIEITDKYNCATVNFVNKVKSIYNIYKENVVPSYEIIYDRKYAFIMNDIPIHFGKQDDYKNIDDIDDATSYLGLYCRSCNNNEREIILFEDAIKSEAEGNEEYLDNLILKVIVHEYAHAIMDDIFHNENKLRKQDSKLYRYREESLANAFALKVLEKFTKSGFDKIKEFVKNQPEEYRHGLDLYQRDDLFKMMEFWRETKIIGNKSF